MAKEIERKFLVLNDGYKHSAFSKVEIKQCYLCSDPCRTVRLRVAGDSAFITVKGMTCGCERSEWEYAIPYGDACCMAQELAGGWSIEKTRWLVRCGGMTWEVDEFHGRHRGLVVAEVELPSVGAEVRLPDFAGVEVTSDPRYYNSVLAGVISLQD